MRRLSVEKGKGRNYIAMRNALGFLIILWGLSYFFSSSFSAVDDAATQVARAIGIAAAVSAQNMQTLQ